MIKKPIKDKIVYTGRATEINRSCESISSR